MSRTRQSDHLELSNDDSSSLLPQLTEQPPEPGTPCLGRLAGAFSYLTYNFDADLYRCCDLAKVGQGPLERSIDFLIVIIIFVFILFSMFIDIIIIISCLGRLAGAFSYLTYNFDEDLYRCCDLAKVSVAIMMMMMMMMIMVLMVIMIIVVVVLIIVIIIVLVLLLLLLLLTITMA
jgi:hypothetical protein